MSRSKQLEAILLGALRQAREDGWEEIATSELRNRAEDLAKTQPEDFPLDPPALQRFGNMILRTARRPERGYTPTFIESTMVPVMNRLFVKGLVDIREEPFASADNPIMLHSLVVEEPDKVKI